MIIKLYTVYPHEKNKLVYMGKAFVKDCATIFDNTECFLPEDAKPHFTNRKRVFMINITDEFKGIFSEKPNIIIKIEGLHYYLYSKLTLNQLYKIQWMFHIHWLQQDANKKWIVSTLIISATALIIAILRFIKEC